MLRRVSRSLAAVACAGLLGGCGGAARTPAAAGSGTAADVAVISGWAQALARGDIGGASAYFATPSSFQISPSQPVATVRSAAEVRAANLMLPCGARLLDARPLAGYVDALFVLTDRPGGACGSGVGATARVAFLIRGGKIAVWRRIPDEAGDAARGSRPSSAPLPPGARSI